MLRSLTALVILSLSISVSAQTQLTLSNITVTEKEDVRTGPDVTVSLKKAEGKEDIVVFADQRYTVMGKFKVKTYNVRRSSVKSSAVYLTLNITLVVDDKKDKRTVEKIFYMDEERTTSFSEKYVIKSGIDVRPITVSFDGQVR